MGTYLVVMEPLPPALYTYECLGRYWIGVSLDVVQLWGEMLG
jgi:hypothetical protein